MSDNPFSGLVSEEIDKIDRAMSELKLKKARNKINLHNMKLIKNRLKRKNRQK